MPNLAENTREPPLLFFVLQSWQENDAIGVHHGDVLAGRTAFLSLVLRGFSLLRVRCSGV
jgi:hypothetical protein